MMKHTVRLFAALLSMYVILFNGFLALSPGWFIQIIRTDRDLLSFTACSIILPLVFGSLFFFTRGRKMLGTKFSFLLLGLAIAVVVIWSVLSWDASVSLSWRLLGLEILLVGFPLAYGLGGLSLALHYGVPGGALESEAPFRAHEA